MERRADPDVPQELVCPHCRKSFEAALLRGETDRHRGFKCPHCRLFVAYNRADDPQDGKPQA